MEEATENAPLERVNSAEPLVGGVRFRGGSNRYALKVASLTTLACLLIASQVFMAYMVFDQKQQLQTMQKDADQLSRQLHAAQVAPIKMRQPMNHFPMMQPFADLDTLAKMDSMATKPPLKTKEKNMEAVGMDEMMGLMEENFELPEFNDTILGNLRSLKKHLNQTNWKSFESWLRNWMIFNMVQQKFTTDTGPSTKTKCQMSAEAEGRSFRPLCDMQGRFQAVQCWPAIGICWCVDVDSGAAIAGTSTRGRRQCPTASIADLEDSIA